VTEVWGFTVSGGYSTELHAAQEAEAVRIHDWEPPRRSCHSPATRHPGFEGPLRILEFKDNPPICYTERWSSGRMTEDKYEVMAAMSDFDHIRASALSPEQSIGFITSGIPSDRERLGMQVVWKVDRGPHASMMHHLIMMQ
jgi:hypothetical protein